jgi:hypothetical protein
MGLRRRAGRWALIAVAVPLAAKVADKLGQSLEDKRGSNQWSRGLRTGAAQLRRLQGRRH